MIGMTQGRQDPQEIPGVSGAPDGAEDGVDVRRLPGVVEGRDHRWHLIGVALPAHGSEDQGGVGVMSGITQGVDRLQYVRCGYGSAGRRQETGGPCFVLGRAGGDDQVRDFPLLHLQVVLLLGDVVVRRVVRALYAGGGVVRRTGLILDFTGETVQVLGFIVQVSGCLRQCLVDVVCAGVPGVLVFCGHRGKDRGVIFAVSGMPLAHRAQFCGQGADLVQCLLGQPVRFFPCSPGPGKLGLRLFVLRPADSDRKIAETRLPTGSSLASLASWKIEKCSSAG